MRTTQALLATLACMAVSTANSCGGSSDDAAPKPSATSSTGASPSSSQPAQAKKAAGPRGPIDPAQVGKITGVVRFEGEAPKRKELSIGGTGGCPEHPTPVFEESAIVQDGKLANVFVYIKDGLDGWDVPPAGASPRSMDQQGCLYVPHVLGMRAGETLLVANHDEKTTHNVNLRSRNNDSLNPVQPPGGAPIEWKPAKRELGVSLECNLHPWMKAWVCVVDHPWFAVSRADGSFEIPGVPPGDYVVEAWHEKFGKKTLNLRLDPAGAAEASVVYRPTDKGR